MFREMNVYKLKILDIVLKNENLSKTELFEKVPNITFPNFSKHYDELMKMGYIEQKRDPEDKRRKITKLTEKLYEDVQEFHIGVEVEDRVRSKLLNEEGKFEDIIKLIGGSILYEAVRLSEKYREFRGDRSPAEVHYSEDPYDETKLERDRTEDNFERFLESLFQGLYLTSIHPLYGVNPKEILEELEDIRLENQSLKELMEAIVEKSEPEEVDLSPVIPTERLDGWRDDTLLPEIARARDLERKKEKEAENERGNKDR